MVWVGTVGGGLNQIDPATGLIRQFRHDEEREDSLASDVITALHEDRDGELWVGTAEGLHRLLRDSGTFRRYRAGTGRSQHLSSNKISAVASDRDGTLWVGTFDGGLNRFDRARDTFTAYRARTGTTSGPASDEVRAILTDSAGRLWIGTAKGLDLLERQEEFTHYGHDPLDPNSLADDYVMSLYEDRSGLLWVGTRAGGVSRWNPRSWIFGHQRPAWLDQSYVMSFADDTAGLLWIGTLGNGLHRFDPETGAHSTLDEFVERREVLADQRVMSLLTDRAGNLWIGTMSGGLTRVSPDRRTTSWRAKPGDPRALSVDGVMSILEARDGRIWLGTFGGGVNIVDPGSGTVRQIAYDPRNPGSISAPRATSLAQDASGLLWVGTEGGGLNLFSEAGQLLQVFRHAADDPESLSADTVYALHVDAAGRIWVGTEGGGLDLVTGDVRRPDTVRFRNFAKSSGLASDTVYGIQSDPSGKLWLSSNAGLTRLDTDTGSSTSYHREQGLQGEEFNFGSHFQTRNGWLAFGGADGFNLFDPTRLDGELRAPQVVLTGVEVMNRPAATSSPYPELRELKLGHRDDVVSFEFAALDYTAPDKNRYAYRLRGFDTDWIDLGTRRRISYTNLAAGRYVLEVRAANPDGAWSPAPLSLAVEVKPAPWATVWAKALYALAIGLIVFSAWRVQRRKLELAGLAQQRLEQEVADRTVELRERNEELARVSRAKSDFLSRMSHEIRTPMNGVIGMADLLRRTELSRRQSQLASTIHTSARSLLQILNEILDLARVESGKLTLETAEFDLREAMEEAAGTFVAQAEAKGLELTVSPPVEADCRILGDPLRTRQLLQNLIGNAIKFTHGGEVNVTGSMRETPDGPAWLEIAVQDTGIGMTAETQQRIFEPFSQADESTTRRFGGTGLGLSICRQLVELMGGTLSVRSESGVGSTFTLRLPLQRATAGAAAREAPLSGVKAQLACRRVGLSRAVLRQASAWGMELHETEVVSRDATEPAARSSAPLWIVDADSQAPILEKLQPRRQGDRAGPVVVLANTTTAARLRLEERFGADCVVGKPFRYETLLRALSRAAGTPLDEATADAPAAGDALVFSGHVLVVEDNPVNAAVAEGMLTELGCTCTLVEGGGAAVARAAAQRFDAILMDLHMPDLDGFEATRLIRKAETDRRTPIIALTADAAGSHRDLCLSADMDDFLGKPFALEELQRTLGRWLTPLATVRHPAGFEPAAAAGVLDGAAIARIRALSRPARPSLLPKVISLFVSSSSEQLRALRAVLDRGDLEAASGIAHSLKAAAGNVGASELARLAASLERACQQGAQQRATDLADQMADAHPAVLSALQQEVLRETA